MRIDRKGKMIRTVGRNDVKWMAMGKDYKDKEITFEKGMLRFDVMEKPHSVHVAPSFYLWSIV